MTIIHSHRRAGSLRIHQKTNVEAMHLRSLRPIVEDGFRGINQGSRPADDAHLVTGFSKAASCWRLAFQNTPARQPKPSLAGSSLR